MIDPTRLDDLIAQGKMNKEITAILHCCERTVTNRRKALGVYKRGNGLDYEKIDKMLRAGQHPKVIAKKLNCSFSPIKDRKRKLGLTRPHRVVFREGLELDQTPMIMPADRARSAAEATRKRLHMDRETFERVWMPRHKFTLDQGYVEARG